MDPSEMATVFLHGSLAVLAISASVKVLVSSMTTGYGQVISVQGKQIHDLQDQAKRDSIKCAEDNAAMNVRIEQCEKKWAIHEAGPPVIVDRRGHEMAQAVTQAVTQAVAQAAAQAVAQAVAPP